MPGRPISTEGFVLSKTASGETHLRYQVFSEEHGLILCLKRQTAKSPPKAQPDLFDHAALDLEQPQDSRTYFIRDYRVLRRHAAIGGDYRTLVYASQFAAMLVKNLTHLERFEKTYRVCGQALDHWDKESRPEVVFFKSVYLFAREEGYPVKEDWWRRLPKKERETATAVLKAPVDEQTSSKESVEGLVARLKGWLGGHTDILV